MNIMNREDECVNTSNAQSLALITALCAGVTFSDVTLLATILTC